MIRRRIKEGNFSDVLPPPPRKDGDADDTGNHGLSPTARGNTRVYACWGCCLCRRNCCIGPLSLFGHTVMRVGVSSLVSPLRTSPTAQTPDPPYIWSLSLPSHVHRGTGAVAREEQAGPGRGLRRGIPSEESQRTARSGVQTTRAGPGGGAGDLSQGAWIVCVLCCVLMCALDKLCV
jgi:hypothetical protein